MSRSVQWQRVISDAASWRQDQALNATIYILRETGPTGFLLKEEGEAKNFKVFLGDPHKCTCPVFMKEKDLCKHICWVLLKKFKIPRQNSLTWQLGLVEREINEILRGSLTRQEGQAASHRAKKYAAAAREMGLDPESGKPVLEQREIGVDDVCPICQEGLLEKHLPVTFCKFGCGNSVHIKCMKVWAEHQKGQGKENIECPFCRKDFGPLSLLKQELRNSSQREARAERMNEHLGAMCKKCHVCPIIGKCYMCSICESYYLCQTCFNSPTHQEHGFQFRQKPSQRWRPAPKRGQGGILPDAVINSLMTREISESDYDLLLQLDSQSGTQTSDLTEQTVQSFPSERIRGNHVLLAPGQQCCVCLRGYELGQYVRRLPCHHKFHRDCIDDWLLHRRASCPIDGTTYTNQSVQEMNEANRAKQRQKEQNTGDVKGPSSSGSILGRRGSRPSSVPEAQVHLEIPGVGLTAVLDRPQQLDPMATSTGSRSNRRGQNPSVTPPIPNGTRVRSGHHSGRVAALSTHSHGPSVGGDLSTLTFGDLVVAGVSSQGDSHNGSVTDDTLINMVTRENQLGDSTNRNSAFHRGSETHQRDFRTNVNGSQNDSSNISTSPLDANNVGTFTNANSRSQQILLFDPETTQRASSREISFDHLKDRLERIHRRQRLPHRNRNVLPTQGPAQANNPNSLHTQQTITVDGSAVSESGVAQGEVTESVDMVGSGLGSPVTGDMATISTTSKASQQASISNSNTVIASKPPSGTGSHGNHGTTTRPKEKSSVGERQGSMGRAHSLDNGVTGQQDLESLYVGQKPSAVAGFTSDFLLSVGAHHKGTSKGKPRKASLRRTDTTSDRTEEAAPDMTLSGNHVGTRPGHDDG